MDYESRKIKWYWLFLFVLYCTGVVYFLFQNNPFLYSRSELRAAFEVIANTQHPTLPSKPELGKLSQPTFQSRYNLQRTATDPMIGPRSKNDVEYIHTPVDFDVPNFSIQNVSQDATGFYVTGQGPWVIALGLDGKIRWKFHFHSHTDAKIHDQDPLPVLLDESSAYLFHPDGEVVCLEKASGKLRWLQDLKMPVIAKPILWKKNILIPSAEAGEVKIVFVDRLSGQVEADRPDLEVKPGFELSESPDLNLLILTVDNKVYAVDPEDDWKIAWSQTVTDPIRGPAITVGTQIYVATLGAKLVKLDGTKHGKLEWEADLGKPAASSPAYLPIVNRVSVMDTSGAISSIDGKSGKVYWRAPSENRAALHETWSARLKGQHIEEYHMDWLHKGWTVWAPCSDSAFCIYTPNKGELVNRIALSGRPLALPLPYERRLVFLTQNRAGHYIISQVIEESELKKLNRNRATD